MLEIILWTNIGGLVGIFFFAYLSEVMIRWWNRRIVRVKQRYGLIGIAATTPLLLSIPIGTFLVVRYYRTVRTKFIYLASANLVWSVIYTSFYIFWDGVLFNRARTLPGSRTYGTDFRRITACLQQFTDG